MTKHQLNGRTEGYTQALTQIENYYMVKFCLILEITSKLINRFPTAVMCELLGTRCEAVMVNYRCRRADVTFPTDGHDTI